MRTVAVVVAAGRGSRAGGDVAKQYRQIGGRPVLARTLEAFLGHSGIDAVICAIHSSDQGLYAAATTDLAGREGRLMQPVTGGATRQLSVGCALDALVTSTPAPDLCLIHDAARPFLTSGLIDEAIAAATRHGAAVPGVQPTDTTKRIDAGGIVVETIDRTRLRTIQTPQAFRFPALLDAHRRAREAGLDAFSDDGALAEWAGLAVQVFPGDAGNVKITHAADFAEAERRLTGHATMITRVGMGFDVHAFTEGDHVWLGGVRIAHDRGVLAHSDGDVVLHALTDALLGAIGEGDIGTHFPPSDPQWRGAASDRFLAHAAGLVRAAGGIVDHLDVTVMCERPKIGPNRAEIRDRIAAIVGLPLGAVSIKATTTEELGFTGRREGLAAQAAATVRMPASP